MDIGVDFDIDFYEIMTLVSNRNARRFRTEIRRSFVSDFLHVRHVSAAGALVLRLLCVGSASPLTIIQWFRQD